MFKAALGNIIGGRVLDVATGEGGFIGLLQAHLKDYTSTIGVDSDATAVKTARRALDQPRIRFLQMDGAYLGFADASFDTVDISASLHHLAHVRRILSEMARVLRPGGNLIIAEMHRDAQTEPQRTAVRIHHWAAQVDAALGVTHYKTLARQELVDHVERLGMGEIRCFDLVDTESDPLDPTAIQGVEGYLDRFMERARRAGGYQVLRQRGEALRQRLYDVGVQREPVLIITAQKPSPTVTRAHTYPILRPKDPRIKQVQDETHVPDNTG